MTELRRSCSILFSFSEFLCISTMVHRIFRKVALYLWSWVWVWECKQLIIFRLTFNRHLSKLSIDYAMLGFFEKIQHDCMIAKRPRAFQFVAMVPRSETLPRFLCFSCDSPEHGLAHSNLMILNDDFMTRSLLLFARHLLTSCRQCIQHQKGSKSDMSRGQWAAKHRNADNQYRP